LTLVLLDTNAYLRLAKRIRPLLGEPFGQKGYVLTILKEVEDEVSRNSRLRFHFTWFNNTDIASERCAKRVRPVVTESRNLTPPDRGRRRAEADLHRSAVRRWQTTWTVVRKAERAHQEATEAFRERESRISRIARNTANNRLRKTSQIGGRLVLARPVMMTNGQSAAIR